MRLFRRLTPLLAAAAILVGFALAIELLSPRPWDEPQAAGRPPDFYIAIDGSDLNGCRSPADACRSFDAVFQRADSVAQLQAVQIAGGDYPVQALTHNPNTRLEVVFRPAPGELVHVDGLAINGADHVILQRLTLGTGLPGNSALLIEGPLADGNNDIRVVDSKIRGRLVVAGGTSNLTVRGGEVCCYVAGNADPQIGRLALNHADVSVVIDGVYFHDIRGLTPDPGTGEASHTECLQLYDPGASGSIVVRNSRFQRCGRGSDIAAGIRVGTLEGDASPLRHLTFENNLIESAGRFGVSFHLTSGVCEDNVVWHNSMTGLLQVECDALRGSGMTVAGNISYERGNCTAYARGRWVNNVFERGQGCGSNVRIGPVRYRDRARLDLHLLDGSVAIGAGHSDLHPGSDYDREPRPLGDVDAGADERW